MAIRFALHCLGFRFRVHRKNLPGKPDLVFPKDRAVILVHGCFWHGRDCHLFKWRNTRGEFWRQKISGNIARDREQLQLERRRGSHGVWQGHVRRGRFRVFRARELQMEAVRPVCQIGAELPVPDELVGYLAGVFFFERREVESDGLVCSRDREAGRLFVEPPGVLVVEPIATLDLVDQSPNGGRHGDRLAPFSAQVGSSAGPSRKRSAAGGWDSRTNWMAASG